MPWCSSDPVCIETTAKARSTNLAACHGCALLPETCCEEGNRLLDRALLVGTPGHADLGFFERSWNDEQRMFSLRKIFPTHW